jgi:hypothetical protein
VRNLERQLSKLARKATREIVEADERKERKTLPLKVTAAQIKTYLGPPLTKDTRIPEEPSEGTVIGLAWTETGGDVLVIETVTMKGRGTSRSLETWEISCKNRLGQPSDTSRPMPMPLAFQRFPGRKRTSMCTFRKAPSRKTAPPQE